MSLDRFKLAQDSRFAGYASARAELLAGRKTGHWIWYVFPQLAGLGQSSTARAYAIADLAEAEDYLRDPRLRSRLADVTAIVAQQLRAGVPLEELMGSRLDAMKLVSSLTLFEAAAAKLGASGDLAPFATDSADVLRRAEAQGLARCPYTLRAIEMSG